MKDMLKCHIASRDGGGAGDIYRPGACSGGTREVQHQFIAADLHIKRDSQRCIADAVIVEPVITGIVAVSQLGYVGAHQAGRARA
jgi:hypothetical protein